MSTYPLKDLFALFLFAVAVYLAAGFGTLLLAFVPIVVALLLGSRLVGLLYAAATAVSYFFLNLNLVINTPTTYSLYIYLLMFGAVLFFVGKDLFKAFKNNEA